MTGKKAALVFTLCLLSCFVLPGMVEADKPSSLQSTTSPTKSLTVAHSKPTLTVEAEAAMVSIPLPDELVAALVEACEVEGVPLELALAVMEQESGFEVDAVGWDGHDIGLMQLRDKYHWWLTEQTGADPMTPDGNIKCGVWLLGYRLGKYSDTATSLTAYRWGSDSGEREYAKEVMERVSKWESVLRQ